MGFPFPSSANRLVYGLTSCVQTSEGICASLMETTLYRRPACHRITRSRFCSQVIFICSLGCCTLDWLMQIEIIWKHDHCIVFPATSLCPTTMFSRQMELCTSTDSRRFTCLQQPKHAYKHLWSSTEHSLHLSSIKTQRSPQHHL